jgi:hypothetical protein
MALVLSFPLWAIASRHRKRYLKGWWLVASGQYSWVGYIPHHGNRALPRIKPGIFTPLENLHDMVPGSEIVERLNFLYARDWAEWNDLELLF